MLAEMENENQSCVTLPKAENGKNEDSFDEKNEASLSNKETGDLKSVYKYTSRIKSFLGWESSDEDVNDRQDGENDDLKNLLETNPLPAFIENDASHDPELKDSSTEQHYKTNLSKESDNLDGAEDAGSTENNPPNRISDIDSNENRDKISASSDKSSISSDNVNVIDKNQHTNSNLDTTENNLPDEKHPVHSSKTTNTQSNACDSDEVENDILLEANNNETYFPSHTDSPLTSKHNSTDKDNLENFKMENKNTANNLDKTINEISDSMADSTSLENELEQNGSMDLQLQNGSIFLNNELDRNLNNFQDNDEMDSKNETSANNMNMENVNLSEQSPDEDLEFESKDTQDSVNSIEDSIAEIDQANINLEPPDVNPISNFDLTEQDTIQPISLTLNETNEESQEVDNNLKITETQKSTEVINDVEPSQMITTELTLQNKSNITDTVLNSDTMDVDHKDESSLKNKNVSKPYLENVRRLSADIAKDVLGSARSSIHEKFINRTEELDDEDYLENGFKTGVLKFKESLNGGEDEVDRNNEDYIDQDSVCGMGCFKPKWLQKYATVKVYLFFFSLIGVVHGAYYNYFIAMISTLEKRYAFETKISGTFLLADEITPLILGIVVGYIGDKTHRPRMVALGMILSVICCFVTALPYFIYGSVKHFSETHLLNKTTIQYCDIELNNYVCDVDDRTPTMPVAALFYFASFLKGFATLSYYVIGIPYMDDNAKKENSPLYIATALALRFLGPLVGFLMSSGSLKLYENPFEDPGFGPDDPRWIGAWWLGFCVQGVLLLICTIPIALFPKRLPSQRRSCSVETEKIKFKDMFTGLWDAIKRLSKNPIFIFLAIDMNMKIFGHFGYSIVLPKYMENQFRLSAANASLFSGATSVACTMVATILGGFLIWKYRPKPRRILTLMIATEIIMCIGFFILMIPRCETPLMRNYGTNTEGLILNSTCNQDCGCSTSFTPFCGQDGKTTYFSPCYAGCTHQLDSVEKDKTHQVFGNCSCAPDEQKKMGGTITEGFCIDENCKTQSAIYIGILLILVLISNTFTVAQTMILLRCVNPTDKSFALGTFETLMCLFGFIPFPVTFGALVDSACLVWEKSCDETGNCWFYDIEKYNYLIHGVSSLFCFFSIFCLVALYLFSPRLKNFYNDDDENTVENMNIKLDTVSSNP